MWAAIMEGIPDNKSIGVEDPNPTDDKLQRRRQFRLH
jgi:hypothetical protein